MIGCDTLRDELKAYLDGEMPLARRYAVRRHLAACQACREEVETMAEIAEELRAAEGGQMSAALRARILDGVAGQAEAPPPADAPAARPMWRRPMTLWAAAATGVLAWFVVYPQVANLRQAASTAGSEPAAKLQNMARQDAGVAARPPATAGPSAAPFAAPGERAAIRQRGRAEWAAGGAAGWPGAPAMGPIRDVETTAGTPATAQAKLTATSRFVRKEASIAIDVDGVEAKAEAVEQMAREAGGFVEQNTLTTEEGVPHSAALSLKVPVAQFEPMLRRIARLGTVTAKNVTGQDITEQVSDEQQAALALADSVRQAEATVRAQARGGANPAADYSLRSAQVALAQARGRLALSRKLAALASVTVDLRERPRTRVNGGGFLDEMGDTGRSAVNSFLTAARLPVLLLIWVLAYSPVWVPLLVAYRYASRAQRRRAADRETRAWQARHAPQQADA